jgi:hypothetical protein
LLLNQTGAFGIHLSVCRVKKEILQNNYDNGGLKIINWLKSGRIIFTTVILPMTVGLPIFCL